MNNKQIDALIRAGDNAMKCIDDGLYLRIARGKPSWVVKYSLGGKRSQIALPNAYPNMSISEAKMAALQIREQVKLNIDPKSKRKAAELKSIRTVNQLFEDWHQNYLIRNFKHPEIPARYYRKEMKRHIGVIVVSEVTPQHIRLIIDSIVASGRQSVANKALLYAKQMFNHAIKLNLTAYNPAQAFTPKDAGGTEHSRTRALQTHEIQYAFSVLNQQRDIFTRDNYLACCLLLCLGCRKGELISAKWEQFDLENKIWNCVTNKKRKDTPNETIIVPLSDLVICWLKELQVRAAGSSYVFPARRASKRREYISDDTLNHALAKIFGLKVDSKKSPYPNFLPDIEPFTVQDLRRTCRSLLAELGINEQIAERCLNHKIQGVMGVYDRHNYYQERKSALKKLSDLVEPLLP